MEGRGGETEIVGMRFLEETRTCMVGGVQTEIDNRDWDLYFD